LNNTSPQAHTESELDVFGVPGKLVKYVVHLFKRKKKKKKKNKNKNKNIFYFIFSSHKLPKQQSNSF
jgi:hypothetical protein